MKTFRGKIVAADITERTITIEIKSLGGAKGAVMGEEVTISPTTIDNGIGECPCGEIPLDPQWPPFIPPIGKPAKLDDVV